MSLEQWLEKNCPNDRPKYYSFNYEKYKRDTVNEEKKHKAFFIKKMEKIAEGVIMQEFARLGDSPYVVDDLFVKRLIEKIKHRM